MKFMTLALNIIMKAESANVSWGKATQKVLKLATSTQGN